MVSEEQLSHNKIRYAALLAALDRDNPVPNPNYKPALQFFGAALARRQSSPASPPAHQNGKNGTHKPAWASPEPGSFVAELEQEAERLRRIIVANTEGLWMKLLDVIERLQAQEDRQCQGAIPNPRHIETDATATCNSIGASLVAMESFVRRNVAACAQLAEMHDTGEDLGPSPLENSGSNDAGGSEQNPLYIACFHALMLGSVSLGPILVGLSDVYEHLRGLQSCIGAAADEAAWVPPTRFMRKTTKFWLQPHDVMRFKCEMIKHLPVLVFGEREKLMAGGSSESLRFLQQESVTGWSSVSSVYYDSTSLQTYMDRLRRSDQASVVRVRWYGHRSQRPSQQLFIEQKVHREPWTGESSFKERCPVEQQHLQALVAGEALPPSVDESADDGKFLQKVQALLAGGEQVLVLRTVYDRVAFQESSNNLVRVSLDAHLHMIKELGAPRQPGDWCRDHRAPLLEGEVVHFPYCVVEVKLQLDKPPDWLQAMVTSGMLVHAPRFSKYLHGVASIYPNEVEKMPYWFLHNQDGTMSHATWEEMADTSDELYTKNAAPWLFPAVDEVPLMGRLSRMFRGRRAAAASSNGNDVVVVDQHTAPPDSSVAEPGPDLDARPVNQKQQEGPGSPLYPPLSSGPSCESHLPLIAQPNLTTTSLSAWSIEQIGKQEGAGTHTEQGGGSAEQEDLPLSMPAPSTLGRTEGHTHADDTPPASMLLLQRPYVVDIEAPAAPGDSGLSGVDAPGEGPPRQRWWATPMTLLLRRGNPVAPVDQGAARLAGERKPPKLAQGTFRSKALVRTRVEPKTFFANERTFLQWLQISVLLMFAGISLLGGSAISGGSSSSSSSSCTNTNAITCKANKYAGVLIAPVGVLFMVYALFMYKKRTIQILKQAKNVRYDDQRGPVFLVIILIIATLVSMVLTAYATL